MPRFVILEHAGTPRSHGATHWDLMIEVAGALQTWALRGLPVAAEPIFAERLPDHRVVYLDFEGPVSEDRGHVTRWDAGEYELTREDDQQIELLLNGDRLQGTAILSREAGDEGQYRLMFSPNNG